MKTLREQIINMGARLANDIGDKAIKVGEVSMKDCSIFCLYEPKFPLELLQNDEK
jgi:cyclic lactone autoinducer peptide